jgi:hypothetical protein
VKIYKILFSEREYPVILFGDLNFRIKKKQIKNQNILVNRDELIDFFTSKQEDIFRYLLTSKQEDIFRYIGYEKMYDSHTPNPITLENFNILPTCFLNKERNSEPCKEKR